MGAVAGPERWEISDIIYTQMNRHVAVLSEMHTGCDRIANTPIPFCLFSFAEPNRLFLLLYVAF